MRDNPYKRLPPIERRPDGSLYCMNPAQRKQANALSGGSAVIVKTGLVSPLATGTATPARR